MTARRMSFCRAAGRRACRSRAVQPSPRRSNSASGPSISRSSAPATLPPPSGRDQDRRASRQFDARLCRHARRTIDRRGRAATAAKRRATSRAGAQRKPRASLRRGRRGALSGGARSRLGRQAQHDVLIVVAEAAAENVDAAGMAGVGLDLDPEPDRVMGGNIEIAQASSAKSSRRRRTTPPA